MSRALAGGAGWDRVDGRSCHRRWRGKNRKLPFSILSERCHGRGTHAMPFPIFTRRSASTERRFCSLNTRSQAEMLFQGSGGSMRRRCRLRRITARSMPASAAKWNRPWPPIHCGQVVATSTLDLGIDWGDDRSGHPCRRAEGRKPPCAAHRARQSPHGRAKPRHSGARQSLPGGDGVSCRA